MKRKAVAIFLCMALLAGMTAGCGSGGTEADFKRIYCIWEFSTASGVLIAKNSSGGNHFTVRLCEYILDGHVYRRHWRALSKKEGNHFKAYRKSDGFRRICKHQQRIVSKHCFIILIQNVNAGYLKDYERF